MENPFDIHKEEINSWLKDEASVPDAQLDQTEEALLRFAASYSKSPGIKVKQAILNKIKELQLHKNKAQIFDLDHLPMLDAGSNVFTWRETVKDILPPPDFEGVHLHPLESTEKRDLFVAWVKEYIEEEVHTDILESFLLLEGTCECHITNEAGMTRVVRMNEGDFITMDIGETHDVIITSLQPAKAILQWLKRSA